MEHNEKEKVVSDTKNNPRTFSKQKKAKNFIDGRLFLESAEIIEDISDVSGRLKVDI
jgi:hypothetical protein